MPKPVKKTEKEIRESSRELEERRTLNKINLKLSFDTPLGSEQEIAETIFENKDVVKQLSELSTRSERLKIMLDEDPNLAKQFTRDPLAVVAKVFPELKLQPPSETPIEADRFNIVLAEGTAAPSEGAFQALRRALEYVSTSASNAAEFETDPLGTFNQVNTGQQATDVSRAELALEQVLGIYRIERIPIEAWKYAAGRFFTSPGAS